MDGQTTRYALLRDRRTWDGVTIAGLQLERDGVLTLARVPGPADEQPIMLPGPFEVAPSVIVAGPCGDLYIADTASHHVIGEDGICKSRVVLPGSGGTGDGPDQFHAPRGLLLGP